MKYMDAVCDLLYHIKYQASVVRGRECRWNNQFYFSLPVIPSKLMLRGL